MITDEISFQIQAQDTNSFWKIKKIRQKWPVKKFVKNGHLSEEKKPALSTNIPLISYQKSEQQGKCTLSAENETHKI